ncbi:hypothetical protein ACFQ1S_15065, partial [Kibdelosporangium lantanae]
LIAGHAGWPTWMTEHPHDYAFHTIPEDLRTRLYERLPPAAIPAQFIVTDTLPTTAASGKTDYRRLANPTTARS